MVKTGAQANSMIKIAALVVGGVYLYRRFTEGTAAELKVSETIPPLGRFAIGWGVVFFGLSLLAGPWPTLAGDMALLVMIASVLSNGVQVSKDLSKGLQANRSKHSQPRPGSFDKEPKLEVRSA